MTKTNRDDFDQKVKDILAKRVGYRCSNPNCRQLTCGPQDEPSKTINIGVASHICAAAPGGPRYNKNQTPEERKSIENGIWLCQSHSKLIDSDESRYTVEILKQWKKLSESAALLELENSTSEEEVKSDIKLIKSYMLFFDRPAFQRSFDKEGFLEDFDQAMLDTIIGLNTGSLKSRDGKILHTTNGKSYIQNIEWREKLTIICDLLVALRERYALAKKQKEISIDIRKDGSEFYCIYNDELTEWFNSTRYEILNMFSNICLEAGLKPTYVFPRVRKCW